MIDKRTFYKPAMVGSHYCQVYIPLDIVRALEIKDRDELEVEVRKTGRSILRRKVEFPYGRKHAELEKEKREKEEFERMTPEERAAKERESMQAPGVISESEVQESKPEV